MPRYVTNEGERGVDIAREFLGDGRAFREIVGISDPFRPLEAGTVLFLPGGAHALDTPKGISLQSPSEKFSNLPGPEQDQLTNLVNVFDSLLGYPKSFNSQVIAQALADRGLANQPEEAFAFMFTQLSPDLQKHSPWAQYGLDEQTYHQEAARYQSMWFDLTGGNIPADLLKQSIGQQWTVQQMMQNGQHAAASGKVNAPWLATGQTYSQMQENFFSAFGHMPTDTDTLRSWFSFRLSAGQVRGGGEAQLGLTQQAQTRMRESEVR